MRMLDQLKNFKDDSKRYVFIVDGETDGLYGEIFAYAAIVADINTGEIVDSIGIYANNIKIESKFVIDNILPVIVSKGMSISRSITNETELMQTFWRFYNKYREESIVIADFAAPVEARMFYVAVTKNKPIREFKAPYPLHELATMLLLNGLDPDMNRDSFMEDKMYKHNPYVDCIGTLNILKSEELLSVY